ncbi:MAG TPA: DUF4138 domain-containing protein, partial [Puia sp.]|nr:DUF4138 domain-containing protein [Puia sp.]
MIRRLLWMAMIGGYASAAAQDAGFRIAGQGAVTVPVTVDKMTNIVFPEAVQTGVKVSRDVLVQKVKGVDNVIELKAVRRGFAPTNLSVYGRDGRLYSFTLRYVEDTAVLNYRVIAPEVPSDGEPSGREPSAGEEVLLTGLPVSETRLRSDARRLGQLRPFLRVTGRSEGLRLRLTGVYLRDSLEWLVFSLTSHSVLPYRPTPPRAWVMDERSVKRTASQVIDLSPVYAPGWTLAGGMLRVAAGFEPFMMNARRRLVVEVTGM